MKIVSASLLLYVAIVWINLVSYIKWVFMRAFNRLSFMVITIRGTFSQFLLQQEFRFEYRITDITLKVG